MPRDTAWVSQDGAGEQPGIDAPVPAPAVPRTVGERLKAAREARGLSLADMAAVTKIGSAHLGHIEASRIEALPSRPFAIGYVRAYAGALGLDPDALVSRFRAEVPEPGESFRAPVGLAYEERNRLPLLAAAAGAVVTAIALWNVAQRVMAPREAAPVMVAEAPAEWTRPAASTAPVRIGPALPAPAEQTLPPPYVTPGMAEYFAAQDGQVLPVVNATPPAPIETSQPVRAAFNPRGAVYGAAPQRSTVILQARRAGFVIVRGQGDVIHFARQLAEGESYRAPAVAGLTVEVSNPADFDLFRDGELQGALPAPKTSLDKLAMAAAR